MGKELKLWKVFASSLAACLVTLVSSAFWFGGQTAEIQQQRITLNEVVIRVNRIDTEGSLVWKQNTPYTSQDIKSLRIEIAEMKRSYNELNLAVARLNTLIEQQNRLLK